MAVPDEEEAPLESMWFETYTKPDVSEREIVLAHLAALIGCAPRVRTPLPTPRAVAMVASYAEALEIARPPSRVQIFGDDVGVDDRVHSLTMDKAGLALRDLWGAKNNPRRDAFKSTEQRMDLALAVMRAYWQLHGGGLLHGDVHVGNICIEEGEGLAIKLIDFGNAHLTSSVADMQNERLDILDRLLGYISATRLIEKLQFTTRVLPAMWEPYIAGVRDWLIHCHADTKSIQREARLWSGRDCGAVCMLCSTMESNRWWHGGQMCNYCFVLAAKKRGAEQIHSLIGRKVRGRCVGPRRTGVSKPMRTKLADFDARALIGLKVVRATVTTTTTTTRVV